MPSVLPFDVIHMIVKLAVPAPTPTVFILDHVHEIKTRQQQLWKLRAVSRLWADVVTPMLLENVLVVASARSRRQLQLLESDPTLSTSTVFLSNVDIASPPFYDQSFRPLCVSDSLASSLPNLSTLLYHNRVTTDSPNPPKTLLVSHLVLFPQNKLVISDEPDKFRRWVKDPRINRLELFHCHSSWYSRRLTGSWVFSPNLVDLRLYGVGESIFPPNMTNILLSVGPQLSTLHLHFVNHKKHDLYFDVLELCPNLQTLSVDLEKAKKVCSSTSPAHSLSTLYIGTPPQHRLTKPIYIASVITPSLFNLLRRLHNSPSFPSLHNIGLWALQLPKVLSSPIPPNVLELMSTAGADFELLDRFGKSLSVAVAEQESEMNGLVEAMCDGLDLS